jgi:quercetin dioxygenase-like cupin family protein
VAQHRTPVSGPLWAPHELVHLVLDFAPGAFTPTHVHGGPALVSVLKGEMTRRVAGVEETFRPGESWLEPPSFHAAGNRASAPASVAVGFLLPKGVALTIPEPQARDGQRLSEQSGMTQAAFLALWGDEATARWIEEHEVELARLRT